MTIGVPEMHVSFRRLSLSADFVTAASSNEVDDPKLRLPTVSNEVRNEFAKLTAKKTTVRKTILKNVSGCFKPGEMTLVLGQPGSGKSSLMKVLSGRFPPGKHITLEGDVAFNSVPRDRLEKRLPQFVSYVTQRDTHIPTLTVRDTFQFAFECNGGGQDNSVKTEDPKMRNPDAIIAELGLQNCQDTVIGNAMLRGVSGGERKRVTTGEMQFGVHAVSLMDEISTGLDSAATFDIVTAQRLLARKWRKTVVISLLQPSPEVFALFDNVLLMNRGEIIYNGPREQALPYFESLGFKCPPRRDVADFLCDLASDAQLQYQVAIPSTVSSPNRVLHTQHPQTASEYARLWKESTLGKAMDSQVDALVDSDSVERELEALSNVPEFAHTWWTSTWMLCRREAMVMLRNVPLVGGRIFLAVFIGLLFGSLFWNVDASNAFVFMGLVFAAVVFLGLNQSAMLAPFMEMRAVFYKQRRANFFRTSSYVIATLLSHTPLIITESLIFGSIMYWMAGFVADVGVFLLFEMFLVLTSLTFLSWFFFLSSAAPNLHIAEPIGMASLLALILFAGFVVSKDQLPDYVVWIYWIDPVAWAVRAMAISQYRDGELDRCVYGGYDYCANMGGKTMGAYELSVFGLPTTKEWIIYGVIFLVGNFALNVLLGYCSLEFWRHEHPEHVDLSTATDASDSVTVADASIVGSTNEDNPSNFALVETPTSTARVVLPHASAVYVPPTQRSIQRVILAFDDLRYSVPAPGGDKGEMIELLKGISGYALPGSMTALMGSTGAGKTTLLDVIAGRKTGGSAQGRVLLNGVEASDLAVRRCTGYCEQMDVHSEASTFREALTFSAYLRQGQQATKEQIIDSVNESLDLLGLNDIADNIVRGSSMEQMKRLTIGVELAAQPSVLFLDEPTSGLDARSAKLIMDGVRKVADSGRTIVCTIHQPSAEVFFLFDNLLLLQRGGKTVYFGELGHEGRAIIDYFESIPGVPRIPDGGYNPATWMLEVIGAGISSSTDSAEKNEDAYQSALVDFNAIYRSSISHDKLDSIKTTAGNGIFTPGSDSSEVLFQKKRAASNAQQFSLLLQRFFRLYWRTSSYTLTRIVISAFLSLVFGIVYLDGKFTTYQGVNGALGMIYLTTAFVGVIAFTGVLPIASDERPAFYRERASQTYNSLWYFVASTIVEIPYAALTALIFTAIFYFMVGFTGFQRFLLYWFMTTLHTLFQTYAGQLVVFALPSIESAMLTGVLLDTFCFLFMGFNPPASTIPAGYKWLYAIVPHRYTFAVLSSVVFGECSDSQMQQIMAVLGSGDANASETVAQLTADWPLGCQVLKNAPPAVGQVPIRAYLETVFGAKHAHIAQYIGILLGVMAIYRVLTALSMRFVNHQKR